MSVLQTQKIACVSCGATIAIPIDIDHLNCAHCGTALTVRRGEGYIAARLADQVTRTVEESGAATVKELRRVQLSQELASLRQRITAVETESREVTRSANKRIAGAQYARLLEQWNALVAHILEIEAELDLPPSYTKNPPPKESSWWW